jgi:ribonucleoside-diphosphate reductase beta chain
MNSQKPEWFLIKNSGRFVVNSKRNQAQIELMRMYEQEVECFWTAAIFDVASDTVQFKTLSENEQKYIKNVLAFFAGFDGLVNENLAVNFYEEVQLNEARLFYGFQIAMEGIHGQTYSLMLETFVTDPKERENLLNGLETIPAVKKKADWAMRWMDSEKASFAERLVAFACVEGIMFSGSFCAIYWLKKRNLMVHSLGQSNEYIARDEGLHCKFACTLYGLLEHTKLTADRVKEIVCDAVEHELEFVRESLPVNLIGMNKDLMSEYVKCVADKLFIMLGYEKHYNVENPFSWMELISLEGKSNFFEKRVSEYRHLSGSKEGISTGGERIFSVDEDF